MIDNGPTADRLDVVVIGDGYTAGELDRFHADARAKWAEVTAVEPYTTYRDLFNVWTVDAVSAQSGVSGDPGPDTVRDTALGSYFWCESIERLLCVDQPKVDAYVAKAPAADLVIVLANSAKYGGAGYNEPSATLGYEGISTASAGHPKSGQVAIHETGHSLGKLADEYFFFLRPRLREVHRHRARRPQHLRPRRHPDGGGTGQVVPLARRDLARRRHRRRVRGRRILRHRALPAHRQLPDAGPRQTLQPPRRRGDDHRLPPARPPGHPAHLHRPHPAAAAHRQGDRPPPPRARRTAAGDPLVPRRPRAQAVRGTHRGPRRRTVAARPARPQAVGERHRPHSLGARPRSRPRPDLRPHLGRPALNTPRSRSR
ncbi:secreted protein [Streptomyces sp. C]|nr:secreted protein [Streptomyces sp. C]